MGADRYSFPETVQDYLCDHNVLNISTHGESGPWSAAVFYAHEGLDFYFMTNPATQHGTDMTSAGVMAGSIHEDYASWREIKGIQMRGRVWVVRQGTQKKRGLKAFFRKFCFAEAFLRGGIPDALRDRMRNIELFCFRPDLVLWLDNSTGFGNRLQVYPPPDSL